MTISDIQDLQDFCRLVARMREAQKTYFASRSGIALAAAKTLEKRVDDFLLEAESNAPRQGSLLGG